MISEAPIVPLIPDGIISECSKSDGGKRGDNVARVNAFHVFMVGNGCMMHRAAQLPENLRHSSSCELITLHSLARNHGSGWSDVLFASSCALFQVYTSAISYRLALQQQRYFCLPVTNTVCRYVAIPERAGVNT